MEMNAPENMPDPEPAPVPAPELEPTPAPPPESAPEPPPEPDLETNILAEIVDMLHDAIPGCEICDNSPELIKNMLFKFMRDIIRKTRRRRSRIRVKHIKDVLENYPEFQFLLHCDDENNNNDNNNNDNDNDNDNE